VPQRFKAEEDHSDIVSETLIAQRLAHLRVRRRGDLVVVESGSRRNPIAHARFRRVTVHLWRLEMATHTGQWQPTPFRDQLERLVEKLINDFSWTLAPLE
jgi:hypothetical protein